MPSARRGGRVNRERRACGRVIRINAICQSARCRTRCCDAQCASAIVIRINAIITARRGGCVNREGRACGRVIRIDAIIIGTSRRTRCCDAQCAGADVFCFNAMVPALRGGCVNRERRA